MKHQYFCDIKDLWCYLVIKVLRLVFIGLPSAPRELSIKTTGTSITIRWRMPTKAGDYPIIRYRIEWGDPANVRTDYTRTDYTTIRNSERYEHTIKNLKQDTTFKLYISAISSAGKGPAATQTFKTDISQGWLHVVSEY